MPSSLVDAYLPRIGLAGVPRADLATLRAIHAAHVAAIPFENLAPYLGQPVELDVPALRAKLIDQRRGGYCYEHNLLLRQVLEDIGFQVTGLAARVRWMSSPDSPMSARSHMLLKVDLPEGAFLVDVGFGGHLQDAPLRLDERDDQPTPNALYRVEARDGTHALMAWQPDGWRTAFLFTLEPQHLADYVMANWFNSTWTHSLFRRSLLAERLTAQGRYRLFDRKWQFQPVDGPLQQTFLADAEQLGSVLRQDFLIDLPVAAEELWARLAPGAT